MRERFIKFYKLDFLDKTKYQLIVDTDNYSKFDDIVNLIIENYKTFKNAHS
jgi:cytidylate kinase